MPASGSAQARRGRSGTGSRRRAAAAGSGSAQRGRLPAAGSALRLDAARASALDHAARRRRGLDGRARLAAGSGSARMTSGSRLRRRLHGGRRDRQLAPAPPSLLHRLGLRLWFNGRRPVRPPARRTGSGVSELALATGAGSTTGSGAGAGSARPQAPAQRQTPARATGSTTGAGSATGGSASGSTTGSGVGGCDRLGDGLWLSDWLRLDDRFRLRGRLAFDDRRRSRHRPASLRLDVSRSEAASLSTGSDDRWVSVDASTAGSGVAVSCGPEVSAAPSADRERRAAPASGSGAGASTTGSSVAGGDRSPRERRRRPCLRAARSRPALPAPRRAPRAGATAARRCVGDGGSAPARLVLGGRLGRRRLGCGSSTTGSGGATSAISVSGATSGPADHGRRVSGRCTGGRGRRRLGGNVGSGALGGFWVPAHSARRGASGSGTSSGSTTATDTSGISSGSAGGVDGVCGSYLRCRLRRRRGLGCRDLGLSRTGRSMTKLTSARATTIADPGASWSTRTRWLGFVEQTLGLDQPAAAFDLGVGDVDVVDIEANGRPFLAAAGEEVLVAVDLDGVDRGREDRAPRGGRRDARIDHRDLRVGRLRLRRRLGGRGLGLRRRPASSGSAAASRLRARSPEPQARRPQRRAPARSPALGSAVAAARLNGRVSAAGSVAGRAGSGVVTAASGTSATSTGRVRPCRISLASPGDRRDDQRLGWSCPRR